MARDRKEKSVGNNRGRNLCKDHRNLIVQCILKKQKKTIQELSDDSWILLKITRDIN